MASSLTSGPAAEKEKARLCIAENSNQGLANEDLDYLGVFMVYEETPQK